MNEDRIVYVARDKDDTLKLFNNIPSLRNGKWEDKHYLVINSQIYRHVEPETYECVNFEDLFVLPL